MGRKCRACLCSSCVNACGQCTGCAKKVESCERYNGFWQESIFDILREMERRGTPRHSLEYYGLTKQRVEELENLIRSGRYVPIALHAAYTADEIAAWHILLSIKRNLSYDRLEKLHCRGEISRIPCSRTGFYYTKKYFMHLFDKEMRRIGK